MVSRIKLISDPTVRKLLKYDELITATELALKSFSSNAVIQPMRTMIPVDKHDAFFMTMPAYCHANNQLSVKLIAVHRQLATHNSTILHYDAANGELLAMMDGETITEMRTAAASAVATKYLAPEDAKTLAILGTGTQGRSHLDALTSIHQYNEVRLWNRTRGRAEKLREERAASVSGDIIVVDSPREAVVDADVVVTTTMADTPVLRGDWLKPGSHVNGVGACRSHWRELDDACMTNSDIYVDSRQSATVESGDVILSKAEIVGEIGEVANGKVKADRNKTTVFKSLGIASEDLFAAQLVWEKWCEANQKLQQQQHQLC